LFTNSSSGVFYGTAKTGVFYNASSTPWTTSISGLTANTTYYVRAYATNSAGTSYGPNVMFQTTGGTASLPGVSNTTTIPTISTVTPTSITETTAVGGGNVTSNGGSTVTTGGIVWDISSNPTIALSTKTVNSGWADYSTWTDNITGLKANTTYYVRAYATNNVGTAYGSSLKFTTKSVVATNPVVTNPTASCTGTPWGTVANGYSNTAYLAPLVISPTMCVSQTRTCTNGTLSGTYTNDSCIQSTYAEALQMCENAYLDCLDTMSSTATAQCNGEKIDCINKIPNS
jgi:hypothetical protein